MQQDELIGKVKAIDSEVSYIIYCVDEFDKVLVVMLTAALCVLRAAFSQTMEELAKTVERKSE